MKFQRVFLVLSVVAMVFAAYPGLAQEKPRSAHLALLARTDRDSVVLRWAVSTAGGWITANRSGYIVERAKFTSAGAPERKTAERLTPVPLVPWPLDEWKRRSPRNDNYAAIAAQTLYGKTFVPRPTDEKAMSALKNAADELSNRYSFAHFAADNDALTAEGLALRFVDRHVKAGEKYLYRVFAAARDSTYALDTAYVLVDVEPSVPAGPPPGLTATGLDGRIELEWQNSGTQAFSGYYVYRAEKGEAKLTQLTKTPLVSLTPDGAAEQAHPRYIDTTVVNYKRYRYEIRGVTPFAELSAPATVESFSRDLTAPPAPIVRTPTQLPKNAVRLDWEIPDPPPDLAGFVIARSANSLSGFSEITQKPLPKSARSYIDNDASEAEPYYLIVAVDTAGNVAPSLPVYSILIDSLPPSIPTGLTGTIDTNGVVRLRWRLGAARNILGYRVLWANDPKHEFAQRTGEPIRDTTFTDTINVNTLTRYIYYRIAAVNTRFAHSEMSPILALRRPDRFPPEAPVFTDMLVSDSTVQLTWVNSSSDDVAFQRLSRRTAGSIAWTDVATFHNREQRFIDHAVTRGTTYEYKIQAVDSSGLVSPIAHLAHARPYDSGVRPTVRSLEASYEPKSRSVTIHWKYEAATPEKSWFVVYRAFGKGGLVKIASVQTGERTFKDSLLVGDGTYRYAVRVFTDKGGESVMSPEATVIARR